MKKIIIQFIIRLALIVIGITGILMTAFSNSFAGQDKAFLYFTVQSNITIVLVEVIFFIDSFRQLFGKDSFINNILLLIKYLFVVAITITFLVLAFVLAPKLSTNYLLSFENFSLHFIVPPLAIIDFFIFDAKQISINRKTCLLGLAMPIYYFIFFLIGVPFNVRYIKDSFAPYFFFDYQTYTWFEFTDKGPGVFYWLIIMGGSIVLLCYLFLLIISIIQKYSKKEE